MLCNKVTFFKAASRVSWHIFTCTWVLLSSPNRIESTDMHCYITVAASGLKQCCYSNTLLKDLGHEINVNSNINWKSSPPINGVNFFANVKFHRAILVWSWIENVRTKQKQQTNKNRAILLIYRTDTNARGFW